MRMEPQARRPAGTSRPSPTRGAPVNGSP